MLLMGYNSGIVASAILFFGDTWPDIQSEQTEMIVSVAMLGAFFSCILAGPLCDKFGRKPLILAADLLFTIGSIMIAYAYSITELVCGRFLIGLAMGIVSIVLPIYLSEISPNEKRGLIVGVNSTMVPVG